MAEVSSAAAIRRDPLSGLAPILVRNRLAIEPAAPASRFVLRGPETAASLVGSAFGLTLPRDINRASVEGDRAAFRLGPDEWLLIGPDGEAMPRVEGEPHSLVDVGHRNVGLTVSGAIATDVLSSGVMLDLDAAAFPVGMATRTLFVKAEIVLWRREADLFHIEVWRSFAVYLRALLEDAAREHVKPARS